MNFDEIANQLLLRFLNEWEKQYKNTFKKIFVQLDFGESNIAHLWSFDEYKISNIMDSSASRLHAFRPKAPQYLSFPFEKCISCYEEIDVSLFYQINIEDFSIIRKDKYIRGVQNV